MKQDAIDFLKNLDKNNNREWFKENKNKYDNARGIVEDFINKLIPEINKIDPSIGMPTAKECMFRIYRDIRFSKNKLPYKTNFGGFLTKGGRKSSFAGYYLHIEPGKSFLGGGVYMPPSEKLKLIRSEIYYNLEEFESIIAAKKFKAVFGQLEGDKLVRPPQGFPADFAGIDLLKYKSYVVLHPITDDQLVAQDCLNYIAGVYNKMLPFNQFLNRALS